MSCEESLKSVVICCFSAVRLYKCDFFHYNIITYENLWCCFSGTCFLRGLCAKIKERL